MCRVLEKVRKLAEKNAARDDSDDSDLVSFFTSDEDELEGFLEQLEQFKQVFDVRFTTPH